MIINVSYTKAVSWRTVSAVWRHLVLYIDVVPTSSLLQIVVHKDAGLQHLVAEVLCCVY